MAEPARKIAESPRTIARMKMLQSVNFNRTENMTLDISRDHCTLLQTPLGIEAANEKYAESILIPWVNVAYVKYA